MTHPDDSFRPRGPTASGPLLTAALGGLLCFASSCGPSGGAGTPDTGVNADATPADTKAPADIGTNTRSPGVDKNMRVMRGGYDGISNR